MALPRCVVPQEELNKEWKKTRNPLVKVVHRFQKGDKVLDRAEPGENQLPTRLYKPVFTPHKQLGDFGIGVGLYFSTLRALMVLTLLAGFLNIPNFIYYSSEQYNQNPMQEVSQVLLDGSAICTDTSWVPCPHCTESHFASERIGQGRNLATNETVRFALRNNCEGVTIQTGMINYATFWLMVVGSIIMNLYLNRMIVVFDEDEQTATDYSIQILNPPDDATDAEEWRLFFAERFGARVTVCTVAVDNDLLVRSLVERRERLRQIDMSVDDGTRLNILNLSRIAAKIERKRRFWGRLVAMFSAGIPEHFARLVVLTARIQGLAQQDYPASKLFVTFETEADQRHVLQALDVGTFSARHYLVNKLANPQHLFRDKLLLQVSEPDEPSTIRWQGEFCTCLPSLLLQLAHQFHVSFSDLNEKYVQRLKQQSFTTLVTLVAIAILAIVVSYCNAYSVTFGAYSIALFNVAFPMFAKLLTSSEAHSSEGSKQRSLYFKIALFRWSITAVIITIITPFTLTLENENGLIASIYQLFFAEIVTSTAIQLADPVGHLKRHFLAPRAKTQDAMNSNMRGSDFDLAERYTNMVRLLLRLAVIILCRCRMSLTLMSHWVD